LVRTLRNLTALGLLALGVLIFGLGVRSFFIVDVIDVKKRGTLAVDSINGQLTLTHLRSFSHREWLEGPRIRHGSEATDVVLDKMRAAGHADLPSPWGWGFHNIRLIWNVYAPHWFVALVFAALAFALKPKPRLKFSLADLMVLMTFAAVLLAGVAGLSRLAS
jgi:hypothetical protein